MQKISDERLAEIEAREKAATPGPWFAHATDDEVCMNARYVGTRPCEFHHDGRQGMAYLSDDQEPSHSVIAITLLQSPRLADGEEHDDNTLFITHARADIPDLCADLRLARRQLATAMKGLQAVVDTSLDYDRPLFAAAVQSTIQEIEAMQ